MTGKHAITGDAGQAGRPVRFAIIRIGLVLAWLCGANTAAAEDEVQLMVTGKDRAVILFNRQKLILSPGSSQNPRVELVEASSERAVIRIDGQQQILLPDGATAPILQEAYTPKATTGNTVTLWADPSGFFYADGKVNQNTVRFLIDTGANVVTFSSEQADRLGLSYERGEDGYARTASGITPVKSFTIKQISIRNIRLYDIRAIVIPGAFPSTPLLGGTFLNRLDMVRTGRKMKLSKRPY